MKPLYFSWLLLFLTACASLDRTTAPEPKEAPDVKVADYESFELDNGLQVFLVQDQQAPKITMNLRIDRGPIYEGTKAGYLDAAGRMLGRTTENRTKAELNEAMDFIGADFNTSSRGVYAAALNKHSEDLMELTADVVTRSTFQNEELKQVKLQMRSSLQASQNEPHKIANRVFNSVVFGKDHPYGNTKTKSTLASFDIEDIRNYYKTYFKANHAYLAIVGNTSREAIKPHLEKHFGGWEEGAIPEHDYKTTNLPDQTKVAIVNRPKARQSTVRIGHPVQLAKGQGEHAYIKASVTNTILGGGAFRLFENLREQHAYTYGAYSSLSPDDMVGKFVAAASVKIQATDSAISEMIYEMNRLRDTLVPTQELSTAKNYLSGNFAINLEDPQTVGRFALNTAMQDLPKDYYANYLKNIATVNAQDVQKMARQYIHPSNAWIVVIGKASEFADRMDQFGPVEYYDEYGNKIDEPTSSEAPEGLTASDVINSYFKARGGLDQMKDIEALSMKYSGAMRGRNLNWEVLKKRPNLFKETMYINGTLMRQSIYNGQKGFKITPRAKEELPEEIAKQMVASSKLFYLIDLENTGINAKLKGIETINGSKSYKVVLTGSNNLKWTEYFDTDNYLRIAQRVTQESKQGKKVTQTFIYGDYREVKGVQFPHKVDFEIGPNTIQLKAKEINVNPELKKGSFEP